MRTFRFPYALSLALSLASACGDDAKKPESEREPDDVRGELDASKGGSNKDGSTPPARDKDAGPTTVTPRSEAGSSNPTPRQPDASGAAEAGAPNSGSCDASKPPTLGKLALEQVVTGLTRLTYAAQPPGTSDWYLVEQSGQIRVFSSGALRPKVFLDVSAEVPVAENPESTDERGLLGLAFPPDYAESGLFYVMLTPSAGADANRDVVREYKRSSSDPYVADAASKRDLVKLPASAANHNGGNLVFGPDGMLYVGTGDGGGRCESDQRNATQDVSKLFGKILRLDPKRPAPHAAQGNPFVSGGDERVYHYGVRNPYRFGFDSATGDLYIADVGQDGYEEISVAPKGEAGLNFGWPTYEGNHQTMGLLCMATPLRSGSTDTKPIIDIDRRANGARGPFSDYISIIGGPVYRGKALPQLEGVYLFGDFKGSRMGAVRRCGSATSEPTVISKRPDPNLPTSFSYAAGTSPMTLLAGIVQDNSGELYLLADFTSLLKLVPGK